jgi:hypothetical protein
MARDSAVSPPSETMAPGFGPWGMLLGATALTVLALLLGKMSGQAGLVLRVLCMIGGLITAGAAVTRRLRNAGQSFDDSLISGALVLAAVFPILIVLYGLDPAWDWAQMVLRVLTWVTVAGAFLVVLPPLARRLVISLLAVFHFGGILVAVTTVPPPNAAAPWLGLQLWVHVYRPYLSFLYMNNAYHFYSPEPGPPTLIWFRMQYDDKTYRWVKLPVRNESPVPLHYQRLLALTESVNQINPVQPPEPRFSEMIQERASTGRQLHVPLHPEMAANLQYREPLLYSKVMLSAYARFAAQHPQFANLENPGSKVKSMKIYRVTHKIINAQQLAAGISPLDKSMYYPFYQGDYDAEGNLINPQDPFLYWLIPIFYEESAPRPDMRFRSPAAALSNLMLVDTLAIHSGDKKPDGKPEEIDP